MRIFITHLLKSCQPCYIVCHISVFVMASGTGANAHPGPVLTDLTNKIRKVLDENQVFIQTPHTRDRFGSLLVPGKSHVDNNVDQNKLAAAVILNPRNTELQRTQDGAYQVVFEVEFDKPIGLTQFSRNPACHFHLAIT